MASQNRRGPIFYQGRKAACDAAIVTKELLKISGKAAWIAGSTFLILVVPLIVKSNQQQAY